MEYVFSSLFLEALRNACAEECNIIAQVHKQFCDITGISLTSIGVSDVTDVSGVVIISLSGTFDASASFE